MKWNIEALKILARNETVPGAALRDAIAQLEVLIHDAPIVREDLVSERKQRSCYQNTLTLIASLVDSETEIGKIVNDALMCWTQKSIDPVRYWTNKYKNVESRIDELETNVFEFYEQLQAWGFDAAAEKLKKEVLGGKVKEKEEE